MSIIDRTQQLQHRIRSVGFVFVNFPCGSEKGVIAFDELII